MSPANSQTAREALSRAKTLAENGRNGEALAALKSAFGPETDFALLVRAAKWTASRQWPDLTPLRLALCGGGTLDLFGQALHFWALLAGFRLVLFQPPFETWRMEILDPGSELHRFRPEAVWLFTHWRDLRLNPEPEADSSRVEKILAEALADIEELWNSIWSVRPETQLIQNNVDPWPERIFGHFDALLPGGGPSLGRAFNSKLAERAAGRGLALFDLNHLAARFGLDRWHDPGSWFQTRLPWDPELTGPTAYQAARFLAGLRGGGKKVVVTDLDNTLWGGVVGDDSAAGLRLGPGDVRGEAFAAFQAYLQSLSRRGVLLAVASKNEDRLAREPFAARQECRLSLDDFAVFKANWRNKADNIREIAEILGLGLDSFVFLDDNPAERALVRAELPQVTVPELPEDPAGFIQAVDRLALFETPAFTPEDRDRSRQYRQEAGRRQARIELSDLEAYLRSLGMVGNHGPADDRTRPRLAQLINKSNQFHLTTTRYGPAELAALAERPGHLVLWFSLRDRFGDYGLVAAVVLKPRGLDLIIDTWAMSCRVLSRGLEEFILRRLALAAAEAGAARLWGRYLPSPRNGLVAELYDRLGFERAGTDGDDQATLWSLSLPADRSQFVLHIQPEETGLSADPAQKG